MRIKAINKMPASALQKKRVCAYARVSTDSSRQEDSLENQMETYERLITGNTEYEFIGVFADQGISGYCENRPRFSADEHSEIVRNLIRFKNKWQSEGNYTDAVDDLIIKFSSAKKKSIRIK